MNFIDHYREAQAKDEEIAALKAELVAFKDKLMDFAADCDNFCAASRIETVRWKYAHESLAKMFQQANVENESLRDLVRVAKVEAKARLMAKQANPDGGTTVAPRRLSLPRSILPRYPGCLREGVRLICANTSSSSRIRKGMFGLRPALNTTFALTGTRCFLRLRGLALRSKLRITSQRNSAEKAFGIFRLHRLERTTFE